MKVKLRVVVRKGVGGNRVPGEASQVSLKPDRQEQEEAGIQERGRSLHLQQGNPLLVQMRR